MNKEIVVGIPSYNNEGTIGFVVEQVDKGLRKYFPKNKALIVNSDGGSTDGTQAAFEGTETKTKKQFVHYKNPVPGKGSAFKEIWELGIAKDAKYFVVVDSDLRSISPEWIKKMVNPLMHGTDYCTPYYSRHKYDGTITNQLCFPITYGLFCRNIRQPIGGDFSFSSRLANFWLKQGHWEQNEARFGIDIFMTSNAVLNGFEVKQVFLGSKVHDAKDPGADLKPMFEQVVETLLRIVSGNVEKWAKLKEVKQVPVMDKEEFVEPQELKVNSGKMLESFLQGKKEQAGNWKGMLSTGVFKEINAMEKPDIGEELWSKIVFDCIAAFSENKGKVIDALIPLWLGRNYSFVQETKEMENSEAEKLIRQQAKVFFKNRGYLVEKIK